MIYTIEKTSIAIEFNDEAGSYVYPRHCASALDVYCNSPFTKKGVIAELSEDDACSQFITQDCTMRTCTYDGYSIDVIDIYMIKQYDAVDFESVRCGDFEFANIMAVKFRDRFEEYNSLFQPNLYNFKLNMSVEEAIDRRGVGVDMSDELIRSCREFVDVAGADEFHTSDLGDRYIIWLLKDGTTFKTKQVIIDKSNVIEVRYGCAILYNCVARGFKDLNKEV